MSSDRLLSIRCCVRYVLSIRCCIRLRQVRCVVGGLRPDSRLAFPRQVRLRHRTHTMPGNIFADAREVSRIKKADISEDRGSPESGRVSLVSARQGELNAIGLKAPAWL